MFDSFSKFEVAVSNFFEQSADHFLFDAIEEASCIDTWASKWMTRKHSGSPAIRDANAHPKNYALTCMWRFQLFCTFFLVTIVTSLVSALYNPDFEKLAIVCNHQRCFYYSATEGTQGISATTTSADLVRLGIEGTKYADKPKKTCFGKEEVFADYGKRWLMNFTLSRSSISGCESFKFIVGGNRLDQKVKSSAFVNTSLIGLNLLYINNTISKVSSSAAVQKSPTTCTPESLVQQIDRTVVNLLESPSGSGMTSFCKRLCLKQTSDRFFCIFITLRDIVGLGEIKSIKQLLGIDDAYPFSSLSKLDALYVVDYRIPILFVLDGFDEIQAFFRPQNPPAVVKHVVDFLHNFADPKTRASHLKNRTAIGLVRDCDAVLVTSRKDRCKTDQCNFDISSTTGVLEKWQLDPWNDEQISQYHEKRCPSFLPTKNPFVDVDKSAAKNEFVTELQPRPSSYQTRHPHDQEAFSSHHEDGAPSAHYDTSSPDFRYDPFPATRPAGSESTRTAAKKSRSLSSRNRTTDDHHNPFYRLPLFQSLACQCAIDGAMDIDTFVRLPMSRLFDLSIRSCFMKGRKQVEQLFPSSKLGDQEYAEIVERTLEFAAKQASISLIVDYGSLFQFKCAASPATLKKQELAGDSASTFPWMEMMIATGTLSRQEKYKVLCRFAHPSFNEYFCARFIADKHESSKGNEQNKSSSPLTLHTLPFNGVFRTTWLLVAEIAKTDPKSTIKTSDIITVIAEQKCWKEENIETYSDALLDPESGETCDEIALVLPLRLVVELSLFLDPAELLPKLPRELDLVIGEICGEFGALDTLKWLLMEHDQFPKVVLERCLARATRQRQSQTFVEFLRKQLGTS